MDPRLLPLELIIQSYRHLFPPSFFSLRSIQDKPAWTDIAGLSLASKASREIILGLWFHVLRISDTEDWKTVIWTWKRLYQWTRAIHYTSTVYKTPRILLEPFQRLHTLRIDLPTTHVTSEGDFDFAAPELAQIIHDSIPAHAIQHLEIRGITWLDPFVMRHIAEGLPGLETLVLRQPLVWCGLCNTIGAPSFKPIPGRIVYEDGRGLPDGYARYLAPLQHLQTVVLTVACGDSSNIAYSDLFSNRGPASHRKPVGWSGECDACMVQLLEDDAFRETWVSQKAQGDPGRDRPPCLRRVEWNLLELSQENWPGLLPTANTMYYI